MCILCHLALCSVIAQYKGQHTFYTGHYTLDTIHWRLHWRLYNNIYLTSMMITILYRHTHTNYTPTLLHASDKITNTQTLHTLLIVRAGDQLSFKISKQMCP